MEATQEQPKPYICGGINSKKVQLYQHHQINSDNLKQKQKLLNLVAEVFTCHTGFFQFKLQIVYSGKHMQGRY